jgi:mannosyl-3-phosphoglycerate phosphatase
VPVVLNTSKTRAEVRALGRQLGGPYLAIVEDGCGVFIPTGWGRMRVAGARRTRDGRLLPLAAGYASVRRAFVALRRAARVPAVGSGDLDAVAVARVTGLSLPEARRARRREFDEPFTMDGATAAQARRLARLARRRGLVLTRGGRFWHLHGRSDKGRATTVVRRLLERALGPLVVVALGDSPLDAPMLRAADVAILVPLPDGSVDRALRRAVPRARVAPAPGPSGWARAVTHALARLEAR